MHMHTASSHKHTTPLPPDCAPTAPAQVTEDGNGNVKIKCPNAGKDFAPEEISAQVGRWC
jgi:hypothetical protein